MVWDGQRAGSKEEVKQRDAVPAAGLSRHPRFGEFGRKTESHQVCYFFSISEFQVPPASSWAGNTTKTDATMQHIQCFEPGKKSDVRNTRRVCTHQPGLR